VDHGVTFHTEPKLRTVLWGWAGAPLSDAELAVLEDVREQIEGDLGAEMSELVAPAEVRACRRRVEQLLRQGAMPYPADGWPAIPWPPF